MSWYSKHSASRPSTYVDRITINKELDPEFDVDIKERLRKDHPFDINRLIQTPKGIGRIYDVEDLRSSGLGVNIEVQMSNGDIDKYYDVSGGMATNEEGEFVDLSLETLTRRKERRQERLIKKQREKAEKAGFNTETVFYHGSRGNRFDEFNESYRGLTDSGWYGLGYYFSPLRDYAESYGGKQGEVRAFYLRYSNPFVITDENQEGLSSLLEEQEVTSESAPDWLAENGYDAVERYHGDVLTEVMIFDRKNIRDVVADFTDLDSANLMASGSGSWYKKSQEDYRGSHQAPSKGYGAPLHDVTPIYPDDVYSSKGALYYGHYGGNNANDIRTVNMIHEYRNKPDKKIRIYRAVPLVGQQLIDRYEKDKKYILRYGKIPPNAEWAWIDNPNEYYEYLDDQIEILKNSDAKEEFEINPGDWVTINRDYAKEHGESCLNGSYRIISKLVKASDIFTDGNSIHEWGYYPA